MLTVGGATNIQGSITASGDISSSGKFLGNNIGPYQSTFIPLMPQDFNFGSDGSRTHGVYTDDDGATSRVTNASTNLYASKIIPVGFTATGVRVNCSATTVNSVTPYNGSIANGSVTAHTAGNTNADIDLDSQVTGDGEVYIVVKFNPGNITDEIQGGKIYIKRQ